MNRIFLLFFISLPFLSCAENNDPNCLKPQLGEELSIRINRTATYCIEGFSITFEDVVNESRCPSDVTCIWAGFVQVKLELEANGKKSTVELASDSLVTGVPSEVVFDLFTIKLIDVTPYPAVSAKIDTDKFEVILIVDKISS